jgi:hypothetical protein
VFRRVDLYQAWRLKQGNFGLPTQCVWPLPVRLARNRSTWWPRNRVDLLGFDHRVGFEANAERRIRNITIARD